MSELALLLLIDSDPPSELAGNRGFYPANGREDGPDEALMRRRFAAIADLVGGEAGGRGLITLHTSPRYRRHFLREPYLTLWRDLAALGAELALHPHEERADGSHFYGDLDYLAAVIGDACAAAEAEGLTTPGFRSGAFAFHPGLPPLLRRADFVLDTSAAPGYVDPSRGIAWPAHVAGRIGEGDGALPEVPLGWSGAGTDLGRDYLFNERQDPAGLRRVWDAARKAAETRHGPRAVNFLAHGFGLVEPAWRRQAADFLSWACRHGGRLVGAREAAEIAAAEVSVESVPARPSEEVRS